MMYIFILMLISALEVVGDQNCAANKPCVCDRERKDLVIADLLEYNLTPDNREIFNTMFEVDQTNDGYIMNCSDKHFTKIPKFNKLGYSNQPIVDCLDMTHNQIELITESLFYGLLIRCIDFNYNKIKKISRNGFSGLLYSLLVLKLNNNQLTSNSSFPVYFASKFTQLQALFMASNKFDRIVEKSFQSVFSPRLKILDLSFNQINCIHNEAFNGLSSLHYLNLCNNNLGELDILDDHDCYGSTTFKLYFLKNLVALEHLRLCSNNIENIHGGKENFKSNYKLRILNFHDNRIKNISGLFCYYNENKALNSYLRNLAVLDLSNNNINEIKLEDLSCLHNLQELYLQFNNLAYLTSKSFQNLYSLKVLHINNNPKLVPNPTLFFELRYSLIDLVINFNIENNAPRYEFDRILEVLLIENQLSRMENLVLSNSRFENVHLNLAYALLANHHLKVINCTNCSVKMLKYEFKMRPQDIGKALNIKNKENVNVLICSITVNSNNQNENNELVVVSDATVEDSDYIKLDDRIPISDEKFVPTHEWQVIKEGQAIPKGLHVRMNIQTGVKEAKLMDEPVKEKKGISKELEDALKELNDDSSTLNQQSPDEEQKEEVKKKFKSYEELKKDISDLNLEVKTDYELITNLLAKYNESNTLNEKLDILKDLEYYVHRYDNGVLLCDLNGFDLIMKDLNSTDDSDFQMESVLVLGSAIQSNPKVQVHALKSNFLNLILSKLSNDNQVQLTKTHHDIYSRYLFTLSGLLRNFPYAQSLFIKYGGAEILNNLIGSNLTSLRLKIKILTLVDDLIREKNQALDNQDISENQKSKLEQYDNLRLAEELVEKNWCQNYESLIKIIQDHDTCEKILNSFETLVSSCKTRFADIEILKRNLVDLKKKYQNMPLSPENSTEEQAEEEAYFKQIANSISSILNKLEDNVNYKKEL